MPTANIKASGGKWYNGSNTGLNGGAGTIYVKNNSYAKADVIVNSNGITTTNKTPIPSGNACAAYRQATVQSLTRPVSRV